MNETTPALAQNLATRFAHVELVVGDDSRSVVIIGRDALAVGSPLERPGWWIRFWHRVLLGWKWERIDD